MSHPLLKSLISEMVESYLEESYEDDLIESIFEEVSDETWEAIEEAILNELSPQTLSSYKKKANTALKRSTTSRDKAQSDAERASGQISKGYAGDHRINIDRQYTYMDRAGERAYKHDKNISKRSTGIDRANK